MLEPGTHYALARVAGEDAERYRHVLGRHAGERFHLLVGLKRLADVGRRIGPFHAAVQALGVLAEDDRVDLGLLKAIPFATDEVEGVARERLAGPDADVQVEELAHRHDRAEILESLAL